MKILFLTDKFPPYSFGGAGFVAYNLAKTFKNQGHIVFIVTSVQEKINEGEIDFNGLKIFKIYSNYDSRWQAYLSLYNFQSVSKFKNIVRKIKPDIVHAHNIHYYLSYSCLKIAKKYTKKVFLTAHDVMLIHYGKLMPKNGKEFYKISIWDQIKEARKRYNPFRNIVIRHYLRYVDKIFAVSDSLKRVLEINNIKNIKTIHNGINVDDWEMDLGKIEKFKKKYNLQNKKVIFFGGRLSGAKGGDQILKAISLIKKEMNNIVLLVAGKRNKYVEKMEKLVKKLNLEKNIIFTGWLGEIELKSAYYSADVCVVPSICFDSFPTTNLEIMACKKPVIGTCFGGTQEIVQDGKTGYIINPFDIKILSDKLTDLLKNSKKAKKFGEMGYKRVKNYFSLEKQVRETLSWYKK